MPVSENQRRDGRFTQWAAQFAVASELCKRHYQVSFTLGHNTPLADLMVISPNEQHFLIDVKGLSSRTSWIVKRKVPRAGLFYVLALVPADGSNRFFVLDQSDANRLVDEHFQRPSNRTKPGWDGFRFEAPAIFENKWEILPR